jgi:hypothetical protein
MIRHNKKKHGKFLTADLSSAWFLAVPLWVGDKE